MNLFNSSFGVAQRSVLTSIIGFLPEMTVNVLLEIITFFQQKPVIVFGAVNNSAVTSSLLLLQIQQDKTTPKVEFLTYRFERFIIIKPPVLPVDTYLTIGGSARFLYIGYASTNKRC